MECFHRQESHDRYYTSFCDCHVKVEDVIDLRVFQDIVLPAIIREWGWETLFSTQGTYYPHLVLMFYANIHLVVVGVTFRVTMYG